MVIFLVFMVLGILLVSQIVKDRGAYLSKIPECKKGHTWRSFESYPGADTEYLKCVECNKTLKQIMDG